MVVLRLVRRARTQAQAIDCCRSQALSVPRMNRNAVQPLPVVLTPVALMPEQDDTGAAGHQPLHGITLPGWPMCISAAQLECGG
jgi:hypothetical protein